MSRIISYKRVNELAKDLEAERAAENAPTIRAVKGPRKPDDYKPCPTCHDQGILEDRFGGLCMRRSCDCPRGALHRAYNFACRLWDSLVKDAEPGRWHPFFRAAMEDRMNLAAEALQAAAI